MLIVPTILSCAPQIQAERSPTTSLPMGKKEVVYKGRILFLHGFTQSSAVFYAKSSALRKKLQSLQYKAVYLNGPFNITPSVFTSTEMISKFDTVAGKEDEKTNYRAWWFRKPDGSYELEDAIDAIDRYIKNNELVEGSEEDRKANDILDSDKDLPIVGIIGFSQGAALGGALIHTFEQLFGIDTLEFAIFYLGFKIDTKLMPQYEKYYTQKDGKDTKIRLLHVVGELDTVVGEDRAYTLYESSKENSHLLKHPGGHFVPNSRVMIDRVVNWIGGEEKEAPKKEDKTLDDLMAMMEKFGG